MDPHDGSSSPAMGKQEDIDDPKPPEKRDGKAASKALNRVSRACNACRRQKMRCEGAENPPCRRCRHAGLECLFEKPSREASLTGEAGLERIRALESHVADIRSSQVSIQGTLDEILVFMRNGGGGSAGSAGGPRAQSSYQPSSHYSPSHSSPSMHSQTSATPVPATPTLVVDTSHAMPPPAGTHSAYSAPPHGSIHAIISPVHSHRPAGHESTYRSPSQGAASSSGYGQGYAQHASSSGGQGPSSGSGSGAGAGSGQHHTLPPISSLQAGNVPSVRYHEHAHLHAPHVSSSLKRPGVSISAVTSADSSDVEDEDGELPRQGMVAPWEVLRGLADVAIERAAKENFNDSTPPSRARTPSPDPKQPRATKRRKTHHPIVRTLSFPDVVSKKIISENEARELFRIFYHGCSTFLPVFDASIDTYDALHERSPFAVNCICMVAALVRDGGGKPSETYKRCLEEVQSISQASLFSPVTRHEAVQAMLLVAGWSENGWLPGGHAVRMAMELSMHKAWPRLLKRMNAGKATESAEDRQYVASTRTWLCLYIFEHQISYGTGRPAILKDDESIAQCRRLLQHPLAVEDDMRLVSTVELMAVRERVNNRLSPLDRPIDDETFQVLQEADREFQTWYRNWDAPFATKYEDAAFYRQSLQIQHFHAELFHNANALRNINGPEDVQKMPLAQRDLAIRSISIARQSLDITLNSPAYREGMKYAVHYTHATATFTASLLLRMSRLFPDECPVQEARNAVERLAAMMSEIPAKRYALTLKLMLKRAKRRRQESLSRSPSSRDARRPIPMHMDSGSSVGSNHHHHHAHHHHSGGAVSSSSEPYSPTYQSYPSPETIASAGPGGHAVGPGGAPMPANFAADAANIDHIWRGFEMTSTDQLPVWLSDQSLGGNSFTQNGMNAFLLPADYMPAATQIW